MVETPPLRVVFFGTPAFAVPTLDALRSRRATRWSASSRSRIGRADADRRRPRRPSKMRRPRAGVPVLQPPSVKTPDVRRRARGSRTPTSRVVAAYGQILTGQLLAIPRLGMINVHASLLPALSRRGARSIAPIIAGEPTTGVTIMRVVRALDAGPMIAAERVVDRPGRDERWSSSDDLARLGAAVARARRSTTSRPAAHTRRRRTMQPPRTRRA